MEEAVKVVYTNSAKGGVEMVDSLPGYLFSKKASGVGARTTSTSKTIFKEWKKVRK